MFIRTKLYQVVCIVELDRIRFSFIVLNPPIYQVYFKGIFDTIDIKDNLLFRIKYLKGRKTE